MKLGENMKIIRNILLATTCLAVTACGNTLDRLGSIGEAPKLESEKSPTRQADYQPVKNWPTPVEPVADNKAANSLWQPGARSFFKDQRAARVGDILTVTVNIADSATLDNSTTNSRTAAQNLATPQIFGIQNKVAKSLTTQAVPGDLLDLTSSSNNNGTGAIGRKETIVTQVAASITQVLPNGNLVIKGTQQVRVNFELREITVEGVIRPEDIAADNTIGSQQIAEARITYGGKGTVSDVQQPRMGEQLIDILSPF